MDCVLRSFAHASDIHPDRIIEALGHTGKEIIGDYPYPNNFRGFNIFELSRIMLDLDFACTHLLKHEYTLNSYMKEPIVYDQVDRVRPFIMAEPRYCLYNDDHMIGSNYGEILDLSGKFEDEKELIHWDYNGIIILTRIL